MIIYIYGRFSSSAASTFLIIIQSFSASFGKVFRCLFVGIPLHLCSSNFALYLSSHCCESIFNIEWFFCWCLKESYIKVICKLLSLLIWNLSLFFKIFFISNEDSRDIFLSVFVHFSHPFWDFCERISISNVISYYDTMCTLIITTSDGFKPFLTSGIPNLKFDSLVIHINSSDFEVYTDCGHEIIIEYVILYTRKILFSWRIIMYYIYLRQIWEAVKTFLHLSFQ